MSSLTRVVAPTVGGFLPGRVGAPAPGVLGALLTVWLVYRRLHDPNVQRGDGHLEGDRHLTCLWALRAGPRPEGSARGVSASADTLQR